MKDEQFELLMQEIKKNNKEIAEVKKDINGINQQIDDINRQIVGTNQQIIGIKKEIAEIKQEQFEMKKMSFKHNLDMNKKIDDYMEINSRQYHQIEDLLEKKYQESLNDRRGIHEDMNTLHALIKMHHGETV